MKSFLATRLLSAALAFCVVGVPGVVVWSTLWASRTAPARRRPACPPLLPAPRTVVAVRDFVADIDKSLLKRVLAAFRPLSTNGSLGTANVLHALRLWGNAAEFDKKPFMDPQTGRRRAYSSRELLNWCLDEEAFHAFYPKAEPLLIETGYGVRLRPSYNGDDHVRNVYPGYEPHIDKLISVLGEISIRTDRAVRWRTPNGGLARGTVADLFHDSLMRFSYDQELEFSAKAYLYYLPDTVRWRSRLGTQCSVPAVVEAVARTRVDRGTCYGIHQLQVMALALHLGERSIRLEPGLSDLCRDRLVRASVLLEKSQADDGSWPSRWYGRSAPAPQFSEPEEIGRVRATGHHLEWIALCPGSLRPSDESVRRAIGFLQQSLRRMESPAVLHDYPAASHAVRALTILAGAEPSEILRGEESSDDESSD